MFLCNQLTFSHLLENWYSIQLEDDCGIQLSLELLMKQMNPAYYLVFSFFKIHYNTVHPSTPSFSKRSIPDKRFGRKIFTSFTYVYVSRSSRPPYFDDRDDI